MKIGLSLSGGGYRAAAYHLGTLKKLHELGILPQVDILSTVSGGSIVGAYYCLQQDDFAQFEQSMKQKLTTRSVIRYILTTWVFCRAVLLILTGLGLVSALFYTQHPVLGFLSLGLLGYGLLKYQFRLLPVSDLIEQAYQAIFYGDMTLDKLPDRPELAIASTNLQTCRPFTFSKRKMEDSYYANMENPVKFNNQGFLLARAVAASSCVPFAFTPIEIPKAYFREPADFERVRPKLIDGGVYDNQGIQKLTQRGSSYECDVIITSDAGDKLPFDKAYNNTFNLLLRTVDTFMTRIKHVQMAQHLYDPKQTPLREIAYLSLGWNLADSIPGFVNAIRSGRIASSVLEAHQIPAEWIADFTTYKEAITNQVKKSVGYEALLERNLSEEETQLARCVTTNLKKLSIKQVDCLMSHAANLTELQIRLYCPLLITCQTVTDQAHAL